MLPPLWLKMELATDPANPPTDGVAMRQQLGGRCLARFSDASFQAQLQTSLPFLLWETDAYIPNGVVLPLHQLAALLLHGMSLDENFLTGRPFAQLMSPTRCYGAVEKLISNGLSFAQPFGDPNTFIFAIQSASSHAGTCPD